MTSCQTLLRVPCGGGHRSWDMQLYQHSCHQADIVYVKSQDLVLCRAELQFNQSLLKVGLHQTPGGEELSVGTLFSINRKNE